MLLSLLFENPAIGIVLVLAIALAISVHEAAHAWTAQKLGDSTAAALGRITLNPLAHLDPVGSIMLLIAGFGWGKPVPVNDAKLRRPIDMVLVALAGPASNLALAVLMSIVVRIAPVGPIQDVAEIFVFLNLALMLFNLIPIPPLDGSKLLQLVMPRQAYMLLEQYGFFLIILLFVFLRFGSFGLAEWLSRGVHFLFQVLTGSRGALF